MVAFAQTTGHFARLGKIGFHDLLLGLFWLCTLVPNTQFQENLLSHCCCRSIGSRSIAFLATELCPGFTFRDTVVDEGFSQRAFNFARDL